VAIYFFDSSAIVKRYLNEIGTTWVTNIFDPASDSEIYIARVSGAEVVAAIARRGLTGSIPASKVTSSISQFRREFVSAFQIVEITPTLVARAMDAAEIYALRGYDSVQLASALEMVTLRSALGLTGITFVSADSNLNAAAVAEGLKVDDPNAHP
jgi:predicted nucleic acid-binding protein